jgi:hypothetical protein
MTQKIEKVKAPNRDSVELLGSTYESGTPHGEKDGKWRQKFENRAERLKYLQTGERYFYAKEGFGSEKRKNPS